MFKDEQKGLFQQSKLGDVGKWLVNKGPWQVGAEHGRQNHLCKGTTPKPGIQYQRKSEELYGEILVDLGYFQHLITVNRQSYQNGVFLSSSIQDEQKNMLEESQSLNMQQRRHLAHLRRRVRSWLEPHEKEHLRAVELLQRQVVRFRSQLEAWTKLQKTKVQHLGNITKFLYQQHEYIQDWARQQRRLLERVQLEQMENCKTAGVKVDSFLTREEAAILDERNVLDSAIMQQRLILRGTELNLWVLESTIDRFASWRDDIYAMERKLYLGNVSSRETELLQASWVQIWQNMREGEGAEWESLLTNDLDAPKGSLDLDLLSLDSICQLSYWRRLWIVQEVLLAKELVLCFGDNARTTKGWGVISKALWSLDQIPDDWKLSLPVSGLTRKIKQAFPFELERLRRERRRPWPLNKLIKITQNSLCRDPRDKIIGLLGVADELSLKGVSIDYGSSLEALYRNAIKGYYWKHGDQEGPMSLFRFSQLLQLSFKGHCSLESSSSNSALCSLDGNVLSMFIASFRIKGSLGGLILPIEKLLADHDLVQLREQDWIDTLVEYLDVSGIEGRKSAIKKELRYLDSMRMNFSLPSSSAYAVVNRVTTAEDEPVSSFTSQNQKETKGRLFFVTSRGRVGILSANIREGHILCTFENSQLGAILQPNGGRYDLIGKAILSSIDMSKEVSRNNFKTIPDHLGNCLVNGSPPIEEKHSTTAHLILDVATIQDLTMTLEMAPNHGVREPSRVSESSASLYEPSLGSNNKSPLLLRDLRAKQIQTLQDAATCDMGQNSASAAAKEIKASKAAKDWFYEVEDTLKDIVDKPLVKLDTDDVYPEFLPPPWHNADIGSLLGHMEYDGIMEQRNRCIRSLRQQRSVKNKWFLKPPAAQGLPQLSSNYEVTESATFPYPEAFKQVMFPVNLVPRRDEEHGNSDNNSADHQSPRQPEAERIEWKTSVSTPVFGMSRTTAIEFESRIQPTYVVLGIFPRGALNPNERIVFVDRPEHFFSKLRWAAFRLRGMRGTLLSLKHLTAFRLYKCDTNTGTHKHVNLDDNGIGDLYLLMNTYKSWHVPRHISLAWADWVHRTLNNERLDVLEGEYALELVLDWSITRISIVVLVPVLLSLAIGIWLNSKAWTDLATIQTAWGTASYIVTAGALLAAMLGFLDIADK
ncbi:hypothetical protein FBEOM_4620 [Fusarium beomiforme]|uniref:Heterokaryon incompatibility domain-containing protein n=1 Tax=Fusarium beomiforme TaxID=44412 RepID=A0A9P5E0E5_9HYPO|nr:hypothetical protein FBEOM_4620 [Fusarium beomiforme]